MFRASYEQSMVSHPAALNTCLVCRAHSFHCSGHKIHFSSSTAFVSSYDHDIRKLPASKIQMQLILTPTGRNVSKGAVGTQEVYGPGGQISLALKAQVLPSLVSFSASCADVHLVHLRQWLHLWPREGRNLSSWLCWAEALSAQLCWGLEGINISLCYMINSISNGKLLKAFVREKDMCKISFQKYWFVIRV